MTAHLLTLTDHWLLFASQGTNHNQDCTPMPYLLLKHKTYDDSIRRLPQSIRHKAIWAQVLLGTRGRTPSVKGTQGLNARWRRTPVQGNHYYMWWIPRSEGMVGGAEPDAGQTNTILIHSIRHHDETDDPIDAGSLTDYEEVKLLTLDPRYPEQLELSQRTQGEQLALSTIKGMPGSGKTVSLLYLVKDLAQRPGLRKILYVTYTNRLKRAAREFLVAQDEAISQAVTIRTLGEIEHDLTGLSSTGEPFGELRDFLRFVETQTVATLGPWRKYPQVLYTEMRAHLVGKSFPPGFTVPEARLGQLLYNNGAYDATDYAAMRGLEMPAAALLVNVAERLRNGRFFQDQRAAQRAIELLQRGKLPGWLAELDALVVDEVQDLTLVQIALLGELVRARRRRRPDAPFVLTVAGDESQIIQPSGFDWGITKDLLGEQLGIWPEEFEFHYQRRSPRNLAQLIDNTWVLYGYLPKAERPSAQGHALVELADGEEGEGHGRILLCPPPASPTAGREDRWVQLVHELADKPGRVLIDLTETLRSNLSSLPAEERDEVLFFAREIKGLERATVLVHGLNAVYERAMRLAHSVEDGNIPRIEARRLFDEMRVALSRSTEKVILLEPADAPVLTELGLPSLPGVGLLAWDALIDTLQNDERTEIEVIEAYLDEVDELYDQGLWVQARRRNRRAYDLAVQIGDLALQREAQEQHVRGFLFEATALLRQDELQAGHDRNRQARVLASNLGDPFLLEEVDEQFEEIGEIITAQVRQQLGKANEQRQGGQLRRSHTTLQTARRWVAMLDAPALADEVDTMRAVVAWAWADELTAGDYTPAEAAMAADLFAEAGQASARLGEHERAGAAAILAERYRTIPQREQLGEQQVGLFLTYSERYLGLVRSFQPDDPACRILERWLGELFANLHNHTDLYARWTLLAQEVAHQNSTYEIDEAVWDLENRLTLLVEQGQRQREDPPITRFLALVAAYHGNAQLAAETWEQLGDLTVAAEYARDAGDLERSFRLLHQAKIAVPEALATTVKTIRLLQQLQHKYSGLRPAERRALLAELAALQAAIMNTESTGNELI
jgi:hypothetical protein